MYLVGCQFAIANSPLQGKVAGCFCASIRISGSPAANPVGNRPNQSASAYLPYPRYLTRSFVISVISCGGVIQFLRIISKCEASQISELSKEYNPCKYDTKFCRIPWTAASYHTVQVQTPNKS